MRMNPLRRYYSRMRRRRPRLRRILLEFAVLVALHFTLLQYFGREGGLNVVFAPGTGAFPVLAAAMCFLLLRGFLLVFGPVWLAVRLWLCVTHPEYKRGRRAPERLR